MGAIYGLIAGFLALVVTQFIIVTPFGVTSGVWGLVLNIAVFYCVSMFTTKPSKDSYERFHGYLREI